MYIRRKKIKKLINDLDIIIQALVELANIKSKDFDADLWLAIYKATGDVADELEKHLKIWRRK